MFIVLGKQLSSLSAAGNRHISNIVEKYEKPHYVICSYYIATTDLQPLGVIPLVVRLLNVRPLNRCKIPERKTRGCKTPERLNPL